MGAGFAVSLSFFIGIAGWWSGRPKSWENRAIEGKPVDVLCHEQNEALVIQFRYAVTNNTNSEYQLPSTDMGALMGVLTKTGSLSKLQDVTWDESLRIPPKQTMLITFEKSYKYGDYNTSSAKLNGSNSTHESGDLIPPDLNDFTKRRLKELDSLAFFDYSAKYKIVLPSNWQEIH